MFRGDVLSAGSPRHELLAAKVAPVPERAVLLLTGDVIRRVVFLCRIVDLVREVNLSLMICKDFVAAMLCLKVTAQESALHNVGRLRLLFVGDRRLLSDAFLIALQYAFWIKFVVEALQVMLLQ